MKTGEEFQSKLHLEKSLRAARLTVQREEKLKVVERNRKLMMKERMSKTQLMNSHRDEMTKKSRSQQRIFENTSVKTWRKDLEEAEQRVNK